MIVSTNKPESSPIVPLSSPGKGEQETHFAMRKRLKNTTVPPCSPISPTKLYLKDETACISHSSAYIEESREKGGTGEQVRDKRLQKESFRRCVRLVFSYLGIENTLRNFQKWDKNLAWDEFAHNIQNPTKTARVNVLWHGEKSGAIITVKLPGRTRAECLGKLDTKRYLFKSWAF